MRVNFSASDWQSGFVMLPTDGGNTLVLNSVSEEFTSDDGLTSVGMILVELVRRDGTRRRCVNIVGMSDDVVTVGTDDDGLRGHELTPLNMAGCWLDVDDTEES